MVPITQATLDADELRNVEETEAQIRAYRAAGDNHRADSLEKGLSEHQREYLDELRYVRQTEAQIQVFRANGDKYLAKACEAGLRDYVERKGRGTLKSPASSASESELAPASFFGDQADMELRGPMLLAAENGDAVTVQQLLDGGADVNEARPDTGETPLYTAAQNDKLDVVRRLVTNGADLNKALTDGRTPLYVAADKGFLEVVRCLIVGHADVNAARSDGGATPLVAAAQNGHYNVALILLKAGAIQAMASAGVESPAQLVSDPRMLQLLARWRCAACARQLSKETTCTRCRQVSYCSRDCQRGHWAHHKAACNEAVADLVRLAGCLHTEDEAKVDAKAATSSFGRSNWAT